MNIFEINEEILKLEEHINILENNSSPNKTKIRSAEKEYKQFLNSCYANNSFDAYLVDVITEFSKKFNKNITDIKLTLHPTIEPNKRGASKSYTIFVKIPSNNTRSNRIFPLHKAITEENLKNCINDNIIKNNIRKYNGRCDFSLSDQDLTNDLKIKTYPYLYNEELRTPILNSIKQREEKENTILPESNNK